MPNHVTNTIRIDLKDGVDIEEFLAFLRGPNEEAIDFERIIPPPENMFRGDLSSEDIKRCAEQDIPTWSDWQSENWGTKWNAYNQEYVEVNHGSVTLRFDTAWAPPIPVIDALREWKDVEWVGGNWVEEFCESAGTF